MELGKQIKKYRNEKELSQTALAERVFVSRQTISNWENDKSYPDIKSLVLLSEIFEISLDQLIKGDVDMMREQINQDDQRAFGRLSCIFTVLFAAIMITPIPLAHFFSNVGIAVWLVLLAAGVYVAYLVEKEKKRFNIQSYKEIVAFVEDKSLDEIEKAREEGKRIYQKVLLAMGAAACALLVSLFFLWILGGK